MTQNELYVLINTKPYEFLYTDPHLGERIIFLTLGGSHAYGTNIEGSDVDIRGCALNFPNEILGLSHFEQRVDEATDTTVYSFNKLISLLIGCNPNTIELLGCKPEHYFYINAVGQRLIDNKNLFLSQRAVHAFGGYANQQLRRLQNALTHDHYPQDEKERHILSTCKSVFEDFRLQHKDIPGDAVRLYIDKGVTDGMDTEIFIDCDLKHYPLRSFKQMNSDLGTVIGQYAKLGKRKQNLIPLRQKLLNALNIQYSEAVHEVEDKNATLEKRTDAYIASIYGSNAAAKAADAEEVNKAREAYANAQTFELVDGLKTNKKGTADIIKAMQDDIVKFQNDLDAALSVSNAITVIEIDY